MAVQQHGAEARVFDGQNYGRPAARRFSAAFTPAREPARPPGPGRSQTARLPPQRRAVPRARRSPQGRVGRHDRGKRRSPAPRGDNQFHAFICASCARPPALRCLLRGKHRQFLGNPITRSVYQPLADGREFARCQPRSPPRGMPRLCSPLHFMNPRTLAVSPCASNSDCAGAEEQKGRSREKFPFRGFLIWLWKDHEKGNPRYSFTGPFLPVSITKHSPLPLHVRPPFPVGAEEWRRNERRGRGQNGRRDFPETRPPECAGQGCRA
jgi:hypothetical protein